MPLALMRLRQLHQAGQKARQRLAAAGGRDQQGAFACHRMIQHGKLVGRGVQPRAANQS